MPWLVRCGWAGCALQIDSLERWDWDERLPLGCYGMFALKWAVAKNDRAFFERVASLRPKMLSFAKADQDEVDRLLTAKW